VFIEFSWFVFADCFKIDDRRTQPREATQIPGHSSPDGRSLAARRPRGEISACDDACSEFNLIFSFHIRSAICLRFSFFQILFHGFRLILISVGS